MDKQKLPFFLSILLLKQLSCSDKKKGTKLWHVKSTFPWHPADGPWKSFHPYTIVLAMRSGCAWRRLRENDVA